MKQKLYGLYAITDEKLMPVNNFNLMAETVLRAGVRIIQYRDKSTDKAKRLKQATELRRLCTEFGATFIINDDIELTLQSNADGIHIGKDDASIIETRQLLGDDKIIGVSCYNDATLAETAIKNGADYIAFGSFFGSSIKPDAPKATPDLIRFIKNKYHTPVCCIGGITTENCNELLKEQADMLAVISDIFSSPQQNVIQNKCSQFSAVFKRTG